MTYDELLQKHKMREEYIIKQDDTINNLIEKIEKLEKEVEELKEYKAMYEGLCK